MRKILITLLSLVFFAGPLSAQFFLTGEDPGHLHWFSTETPYYRIIYPEGADSLARTYGRLLEQFRVPVGRSLGETPEEGQRSKMPVVLHTHNPYSNGSALYAPRRMELYTTPEAYGGDPAPWPIQLACHEPRHHAQMQLSGKGWMKPFTYLIGQGWNPIGWVLYLDSSMGEGDAVAVETGLVSGTRARTADFLSYFRVALDQGDYRTWERWYFGSYKNYTPDLYKISYMTVAGARYLYEDPFFSREILRYTLASHPWPLSPGSMKRRIRTHAGVKRFAPAYKIVLDTFKDVWQADAEARGPFPEPRMMTIEESFPVEYSTPVWAEGTLYALRSGYLRPSELVAIRGTEVKRLHSFSSHASSLFYSEPLQRLYWTETRRDPRWSLSGSSVVAYYDISTGRVHTLTSGTRYYNPQPSPDGSRLSVVEYRTEGTQALVLLDSGSGEVLQSHEAPAGVQLTETAWACGGIYALGISLGGTGLYRLQESGEWQVVLEPSAQKVVNLGGEGNMLEWVSDRSGVNELYRYNLLSGELSQITSLRYGGTDFCEADGRLVFQGQTLKGKMLFELPLEALEPRKVQYSEVHTYPIEDKLTAQEKALGAPVDYGAPVEFTAPQPYRKLLDTSLHTWAPFYVDYDAVLSGSMDFAYSQVSMGASGFFQNTLSTFSGMVGYAFHPDPDQTGVWRSALHLRATYSGWWPVLEFRMDAGDQLASQYFVQELRDGDVTTMGVGAVLRDAPLLSASLNAYLPLQFQRHGMLYGLTPRIQYGISNHLFDREPMRFEPAPGFDEFPRHVQLTSLEPSRQVYMQSLSTLVRAYWMRPRPQSAVYPRLGVGAEVGFRMRPGITEYFAPNVYAYAYGYLPGFTLSQGLRLTGTIQQRLHPDRARYGELSANTLPRGFDASAQTRVGRLFPRQWKLTADYAIPFYLGEITLPGIIYLKNYVFTPHADFTGLQGGENLWSVGADITASLRQILLLSGDVSLGVSFSYMGGSWYQNAAQARPFAAEMIFSFDF